MGWDFYLIVGGSLAIAILIYLLGIRQEHKEEAAGEKQ